MFGGTTCQWCGKPLGCCIELLFEDSVYYAPCDGVKDTRNKDLFQSSDGAHAIPVGEGYHEIVCETCFRDAVVIPRSEAK